MFNDWGDDVDRAGKEESTDSYLMVAQMPRRAAPVAMAVTQASRVSQAMAEQAATSACRQELEQHQERRRRRRRGGEAKHGTPGAGASGGLGGSFLYRAFAGTVAIDGSADDEDDKWDQHWDTKNSKTLVVFAVDHFKDLGVKSDYIVWDGNYKKLKLRADSGANGRNGGYGSKGERTLRLSGPPPRAQRAR